MLDSVTHRHAHRVRHTRRRPGARRNPRMSCPPAIHSRQCSRTHRPWTCLRAQTTGDRSMSSERWCGSEGSVRTRDAALVCARKATHAVLTDTLNRAIGESRILLWYLTAVAAWRHHIERTWRDRAACGNPCLCGCFGTGAFVCVHGDSIAQFARLSSIILHCVINRLWAGPPPPR